MEPRTVITNWILRKEEIFYTYKDVSSSVMADQKVAVVTGSSSGIGYETSLLLARNGFYTYATMRNLEQSTNIKEIANKERLPLYTVQLDVNNDVSVKNATDKILI